MELYLEEQEERERQKEKVCCGVFSVLLLYYC